MKHKYISIPTEDSQDACQLEMQRSYNQYRSIYTYGFPSHNFNSDDYVAKPPDRLLSLGCHYLVILCIYLFIIVTAPVSLWFCIKSTVQHERIIIFRLGRLQPVKGPGFICVLPCIDKWQKVDLRMRAFIIPPQKILLIDGAIVEVGAETRFHIADIVNSVTNVQDLDHSVRILGQTLLVNILGQKSLAEVKTEKLAINAKLQKELNTTVSRWGIEVSQTEISPYKILQSTTDQASSLGSLFSSLQTMLNPSLHCTSNPCYTRQTNSSDISPPGDVVHSLMIDKVFPAIISCDIIGSDMGAIFKLQVTGKTERHYWLDTRRGKTAVGTGIPTDWQDPDVIITLSESNFLSMVTGQLTPLQAYIGGHVQVEGHIQPLYSLQRILGKLSSTVTTSVNDTHVNFNCGTII